MTRNQNRPYPTIPDHDVLRKIGGGAYGEVWLARGVTGALRAVKVVWREDFEDERGFEREFEGILKYEPISRDHPALVNILHVGRSPEDGAFYYYVMELGDDVATGQDINPIEYEPRTLRADHKLTPGVRWDTRECIDVGLRLAEALHHLHENGLAHRDVKPSNVIFVNGRAKLADIGLVAARGQMTFVGTEGFVPPEGPGSAQADIYSLGKVLYEIATGMDRMDFPELPENLPLGPDRKCWMGLNQVICEICEPRVTKRSITTAAHLAQELRRLQTGKRRRSGNLGVWVTALLLGGFSLFVLWENGGRTLARKWLGGPAPRPLEQAQVGMLRVVTTPEWVEVFDPAGNLIGTTPTETLTAPIGKEVVFLLRKPGYRPVELRNYLPESAVHEPHVMFHEMQIFAPPRAGETWHDHLGRSYLPVGDEHLSSSYVSEVSWGKFLTDSQDQPGAESFIYIDTTENGQPVRVVATTEEAAGAYVRWLGRAGRREGYLTPDYEALARRDENFEHASLGLDLLPFQVLVREIPFGTLEIISEPAGAEVFLNNRPVGAAHDVLVVNRVNPGRSEILLEMEGFKPLTMNLNVGEKQVVQLRLIMEENQGVVFGKPWVNGIGMEFAPLGPDLMVSIWETRVSDYALFVLESGHPEPAATEFPQDPGHPVVNVAREDAIAFAQWLTRRERYDERIALSHEYRLPTDLEWSDMVGLQREKGASPGSRDARREPIYPWGQDWPSEGDPPVGNFADAAAALVPGIPLERTILGYDDGFPYTSPVGSFPPNELGLYDLSGNVQEWVIDDYSTTNLNPLGVLRGGGWNTFHKHNLHSGSRNAVPPDRGDVMYGFRVVLAKIPLEEEAIILSPLDETSAPTIPNTNGRNPD
ncbi:MAG: SUMF1/EgtB/PvdO family nonheme iron enzyme [Luteolibacter sp.]